MVTAVAGDDDDRDRVDRALRALLGMDESMLDEVVDRLTPGEVEALIAVLDDVEAGSAKAGGVQLLPHQVPPARDADWLGWLALGGRGAGKTMGAARWMMEHVHGPPCHDGLPGGHRMLIVAPTQGDVVESCVTGPSGLATLDPTCRMITRKGGTVVEWRSGAVARINGAFNPRDVDALRSKGNSCAAWLEELAAWRMLEDQRVDPEGRRNALTHVLLGLRVGEARWVASTTPKPRAEVRRLLEDPDVVVSRASTDDNPYLSEQFKRAMHDRFGGTRLGRQELDAEVLKDVVGALWNADLIGRDRLPLEAVEDAERAGTLARRAMVVGVDPPGGAAECGIVAVSGVVDCPCGEGDGRLPHLLIERDVSTIGPPTVWAGAVVDLYRDWRADRVVGEVNYGGDMVISTLAAEDHTVPVESVRATRGKAVRAQPVATMSEQHRVHVVGHLPELEDEMTAWVPDRAGMSSPNRLDAMVWAATAVLDKLSPRGGGTGGMASAAGRGQGVDRHRPAKPSGRVAGGKATIPGRVAGGVRTLQRR